ncbi:hypothetical protein, partial [Photorhabdus laumondii]|uniref:hypothetical protein n=1 Tax=Photorhabdus laumondii TaxID=2218628 RepID=UPI0025AF7CFD
PHVKVSRDFFRAYVLSASVLGTALFANSTVSVKPRFYRIHKLTINRVEAVCWGIKWGLKG